MSQPRTADALFLLPFTSGLWGLFLALASLVAAADETPIAPAAAASPPLSCLGEQICAAYDGVIPSRARELVDQVLEQVYNLPDEEKRYFLDQRKDAVGFAIFPNVKRQGIMAATLYGKGILSYVDETGGWSTPILLTIQGQSMGPQFGAQSSNIIFTFKTICGLKDFLSGHHHIMMSGSAVAIEHVGHAADPLDIRVHSFNRGMMFGQSQDLYSIHIDEEANAVLYGVELQPGCILEATRSGVKAPWMMKFFQNMQLEPGEAHQTFDLE